MVKSTSPAAQASVLHGALAAWYAEHARDLPWRRTRDPYAILVSEVMLQQTQVARAVPKYHEFLDAFPTLPRLAAASPGEVVRMWSGMGYNGRAVRLHRLAQEVLASHGGSLPRTAPELRRLPGVGPYTAAAVACFAFGARGPVLDTNVYRVLSRVVHGVHPPSRRELEPLARELVPGPGAGIDAATWHQALMDVGATLCTPARPRCMLCPLRTHCAAAPLLQGGSARALAEASVPYAPRQGRFEGSSRFFRGRIVEALRALPEGGAARLAALGHLVHEGFEAGRDDPWLRGLIDGLVRDGLARWEGDGVALP